MPPKKRKPAKSKENASTGAKSGAPEWTEADSEAEPTKDATVDASPRKKSKRSRLEQNEGGNKSDGSKATTKPSGDEDEMLQDATDEHTESTKDASAHKDQILQDETIETSLQGDKCNTDKMIVVTQTETGKTNGKQCLDLSISFYILEKYTFDSILKYWYFIRYSSKLYQQPLKDIISRMKLE